ncbi:hypothetical protein LAZ67_12000621 [Cordylochernes scorpioides]|uniref:Uncharacterized protein n=1 Tax=Cordylochernes scorpioides TaxID=51811 RepID=A0ABY6L3F6_9ARAC|nr:hypothetical protein LAZ67_12000621 [Cordylochernes scorpioides]
MDKLLMLTRDRPEIEHEREKSKRSFKGKSTYLKKFMEFCWTFLSFFSDAATTTRKDDLNLAIPGEPSTYLLSYWWLKGQHCDWCAWDLRILCLGASWT